MTLIMVFDGSYKPDMDDNIETLAWLIQCTDKDRYAWGSLPTISQVENSYITELTCLYAILALL